MLTRDASKAGLSFNFDPGQTAFKIACALHWQSGGTDQSSLVVSVNHVFPQDHVYYLGYLRRCARDLVGASVCLMLLRD